MMFLGRLCVIATIFGLTLTLPAVAEVVVDTVESCVVEKSTSGGDPGECVTTAHEACFTIDESTPLVAVLCFHEAADVWNEALKSLIGDVVAKAPQDIAAIASIETKYDIMSGLLQCDRMQELSQAVSEQTGEEIQRQKSQCDATAVGIAYTRLYWRSRSLP